MSETKHTPLPWRYHLGRGTHPRYHIQTTGGFQVAMTPEAKEAEAEDAAFIVRACNAHYDLVEIAKELQARLFMTTGNDELYARATAAIAKAKGSSSGQK